MSSAPATTVDSPIKTGGGWQTALETALPYLCMAVTFVLLGLWLLSLALRAWKFLQTGTSMQSLIITLIVSLEPSLTAVSFIILTVIRFWDRIQQWLSLPDQLSQLRKAMETRSNEHRESMVSDLQHEVGARCEHIMTKVSDLNYEVKVPTTKDVSTASEWQRERWRQRKLKIQQLQWRRQQQ